MKRLAIHLLLLATLAFWLSGTAQHLHLNADHHHATTHGESSDHHSNSSQPTQPDEDHCVLCQAIATVPTAATLPAPLIALFEPVVQRLAPAHTLALPTAIPHALLARAPPFCQ